MNENVLKLANKDIKNSELIMNDDKKYWLDEALALKTRGYPNIKDVIPNLFEWLKDMNWPGADIIVDILLELPKDVFIKHFEYTIKKTHENNDDVWLNWLYIFINNNHITIDDFNDKSLYNILNMHNEFFK